jgi:uncharacterized protein YceK
VKPWIAGCLIAALSGCATVKTLVDEKGAADDLVTWPSYCHSIPRAYSGVAYRFCNLNGPTRTTFHWTPLVIAFDLVASAIADTVVIPYTGYQQYQLGNIQARRREY